MAERIWVQLWPWCLGFGGLLIGGVIARIGHLGAMKAMPALDSSGQLLIGAAIAIPTVISSLYPLLLSLEGVGAFPSEDDRDDWFPDENPIRPQPEPEVRLAAGKRPTASVIS